MNSGERRQNREDDAQNYNYDYNHNNAKSLPDDISALKLADVLLLQVDGFLLFSQSLLVIIDVLLLQIANFREQGDDLFFSHDRAPREPLPASIC